MSANKTEPEYGIHPLAWVLYALALILVIAAFAFPFFVAVNLWFYVPIAYIVVGSVIVFLIKMEFGGWG